MNVLRIFPAFSQLLDAVSNPELYATLMWLSIVLSLLFCVYVTSRMGANGAGLYRLQPLPFVLVGLGSASAIGYFALFSDLTLQMKSGQTALYVLSSSPVLFVLIYCILFPLFFGAALALGIRALIAFAKGEGSGS